MKRIVYSAALLLALMATACGGGGKEVSELPQIDVRTNYPEKEICLQDVAEVSYVPLETTDEFLVGEGTEIISVSSKGIAIKHKIADMKWEGLVFHRDGKGWTKLEKEGQGPDEYDRMQELIVDWENEQMFVGSFKEMNVYSFDGKHLNEFEKRWFIERDRIYNLSDEKLVLFNMKREDVYRPVTLLSKKDGQIDSLSYVTKKKVKQEVIGKHFQFSVPFSNMCPQGGDLFVDDASSDTIYRVDKVSEQLVPVIVRKPAFGSEETKDAEFVLLMGGSTPQHYLLRLEAKKLTMEGNKAVDSKSKYLMYNRSTGEAFCPIFVNKDYTNSELKRFLFCQGEKDTFYQWFEAFQLIEALEAGELSGKLKTVAEGLKEDDNPVLMVVKFKE